MAKGLGRGLDAFFGDTNEETIEKVTTKSSKKDDTKVLEKVVELNITEVEPMLNQPRKVFDKEKMDELTDSIKENGVIQPILVVKDKNGYTIVAGERRWRAAKAAGLEKIPAIIKDYTDSDDENDKLFVEFGLIPILAELIKEYENHANIKKMYTDFKSDIDEIFASTDNVFKKYSAEKYDAASGISFNNFMKKEPKFNIDSGELVVP